MLDRHARRLHFRSRLAFTSVVTLSLVVACGAESGDAYEPELASPSANASALDEAAVDDAAAEPHRPTECTVEACAPLPPITASERQILESFLRTQCATCHLPSSNPLTRTSDGLNDIDNFFYQVRAGTVIPGDSANSRLIIRMREPGIGSMPPLGITPRPTKEQIDRIARFIDDESNWSR
jgi:hypothetical protein